MNLRLTNLLLTAALLSCLLSCNKNQDAASTSSQRTSQLTNIANLTHMGVDQQNAELSDVLGSDAMKTSDPTDCKVVTYSPSSDVYPHIVTIDFGSGCTDSLGTTISGKRIGTVYADSRTAAAGTLISITTLSNYYVNGINVSGSSKTYVSSVAPFTLKTVSAKTFTDDQQNTSTYSATYYSVLTGGNSTSTRKDDIYQVSGKSFGTEVDNGTTMSAWKSEIDPNNMVIKTATCPEPTQGAVNITINQNGVTNYEYLDYGNGDCDNQATLSVNNGTPEPVTLPLVFYAAHL